MGSRTNYKRAGKALRTWRGQTTMAEVAKHARVPVAVWTRWESGDKRPNLGNAIRVECLTDGQVTVEDWGYDARIVLDMGRMLQGRTARTTHTRGDAEAFWADFA